MKKLFLTLIIFIATHSLLFAAEDYYKFDSPPQQKRFQLLTSQLRCLVCQNQNLAESNAALATDLREQVYQQMQRGQTDQQIVDYLVARYGDFILYSPQLNVFTIGLWFGPFLLLILGVIFLFYYIRKNRRA